MFNFITSSMIVLACFNAVAGSSPAALQVRQVAAPIGFDITNLGPNKPCPPMTGDCSLSLSDDKSALTITFSNYFARVGPTYPVDEWHRVFALILDVVVPPGFRLGLANVEYRAYHQLDVNVTAAHRSNYYFKGSRTHQAHAFSRLTGPLDGANYTYRDNYAPPDQVLSPCGTSTTLTITNDIRTLNGFNRAGSGTISTHDDPTFTQTFGFQWKTC